MAAIGFLRHTAALPLFNLSGSAMSVVYRISALFVLLLGITLLPAAAQAESRARQPDQSVSLLGGKLAFNLPATYKKGEMPEVDAKAVAEGVSGAMYTDETNRRVLIVTETPNPVTAQAGDNDSQVLDELSSAALSQQSNSFHDFQKQGEQRVLKKNGLGVRQLDAYATLGGGKVLTSTLVAASGKRSAVLTVISSARDPKGHETAVKTVIGK